MMNKDYLRQIFSEEKQLIKLSDIKWINVPRYDELSVENLEKHFINDLRFRRFMPERLPKGRMPDRSYYFNVLNTLYPEYTAQLIANANAKRFTANAENGDDGGIKVSDDWWEQLNAVPFHTRKFITFTDILRT